MNSLMKMWKSMQLYTAGNNCSINWSCSIFRSSIKTFSSIWYWTKRSNCSSI